MVIYKRIRDIKMAHNVMKEEQSHLLYPKGVIRPHVAKTRVTHLVNQSTKGTIVLQPVVKRKSVTRSRL